MNWFTKIFNNKGNKSEPQVLDQTNLDMRVHPVDNPLDYREDGSIRKGDPAWDVFQEMMSSGQPIIGTQRSDGTWDVQKMDSEK